MRSPLGWLILSAVGVLCVGVALAEEHPGEHPGKPAEQPGKEQSRNIASEIQSAVKAYVEQKAGKQKVFTLADPQQTTTWKLTLKKFHPVNKISGTSYFLCSDFAAQKGNALDLDFFLKSQDKGWKVQRVLIHKVNGKPRFAYEQKGGKWYRVEGKKRELLN